MAKLALTLDSETLLTALSLADLKALRATVDATITTREALLVAPTSEEMAMVRTQAVIAYRARIGCSVRDAMDAINRARESGYEKLANDIANEVIAKL